MNLLRRAGYIDHRGVEAGDLSQFFFIQDGQLFFVVKNVSIIGQAFHHTVDMDLGHTDSIPDILLCERKVDAVLFRVITTRYLLPGAMEKFQ